jgi:SWI/SNF-related matrix-associated actin-dependent regulator of chromatin subfamily A3
MSARRRQETLEAFSIPIEDTTGEIADVYSTTVASATEVQPTRRGVRSSRRTGAEAMDSEQDAGAVSMNSDDDDEFVPQVDAIGEDHDDDDDDGVPTDKKGKRKSKGKRKATAQTWSTPKNVAAFRTPAINGVNPKVMLISLKAGALGLNLTVANNVYL